MPKKTSALSDDIIEQLSELGKSTARKTAADLKQTFSPASIFEHITQKPHAQTTESSNPENLNQRNKNHTPLQFDKLREQYSRQDEQKTDMLRNRLFQLVKSDEEKTLQLSKQKEHEKKQQELSEDQEKQRKKQQENQPQPIEAQGKQKSRLGQARKKARVPDPAEMKPNSGKN